MFCKFISFGIFSRLGARVGEFFVSQEYRVVTHRISLLHIDLD
jgi:hypothetical protein